MSNKRARDASAADSAVKRQRVDTPMERWSEDCAAAWPYKPSGDESSAMGSSDNDDYFTRAYGIPAARISCPFYHRGYAYGYRDGGFVRKALPSCDALAEMHDIIASMHESPLLKLRGSKSAAVIGRFIYDAQWQLETFPKQETLSVAFNTERFDDLELALRRLKLTEYDASIARLRALHAGLVYTAV